MTGKAGHGIGAVPVHASNERVELEGTDLAVVHDLGRPWSDPEIAPSVGVRRDGGLHYTRRDPGRVVFGETGSRGG